MRPLRAAERLWIYSGDPTGAEITSFNPQLGDLVIDIETPTVWQKTTDLNDNSGYQAVGGGGTPTAITVSNEASDTTCYPLFVTAATGDLGPKTSTEFTFNSSTGRLTVPALYSIGTLTVDGTTTLTGPVAATVENAVVATKAFYIEHEWNDVGVWTAAEINAEALGSGYDTASLLLKLSLDGTAVFAVRSNGTIALPGGNTISSTGSAITLTAPTVVMSGLTIAPTGLSVAANYISTDPTVSLTGTVSISGTALTGVGTAFTTELAGNYPQIEVGGFVFTVDEVLNNTSATIIGSGPALSGETFSLVAPTGIVTDYAGDMYFRGGGSANFDGAVRIGLLGSFGSLNVSSAANQTAFEASQAEVTGSGTQYAALITSTWNTTGAPQLIYGSVTNTASDAAARLIRLDVDTTEKFGVNRSGVIYQNGLALSFATAFSTTGHTLTTNGVTYTLPGVTATLATLGANTFTDVQTYPGGGTISGTSGAIAVTASGTNQNIALTPSGTGKVEITDGKRIQSSGSNAASIELYSGFTSTGTEKGIAFYAAAGGSRGLIIARKGSDGNYILNVASNALFGFASTTSPDNANYDATISRNAAGVLQIGTTTTNASGSLLLTNLTASSSVTIGGGLTLGALTVGTLPTASSNTYKTYVVTDSLTPIAGAAVSAGGSAKCIVMSNGTDWIVVATL